MTLKGRGDVNLTRPLIAVFAEACLVLFSELRGNDKKIMSKITKMTKILRNLLKFNFIYYYVAICNNILCNNMY